MVSGAGKNVVILGMESCVAPFATVPRLNVTPLSDVYFMVLTCIYHSPLIFYIFFVIISLIRFFKH